MLPGSILEFLEDNLQNVTQKADFMRKKKDALPELSITSSKGVVVVLIWVREREEPHGLCLEELGSGAKLSSLCWWARNFLAKQIKKGFSAG